MSNIDIHHHVYPLISQEAIREAGGDPSGWFIPKWTIDCDKALSAVVDNKTAILSITAPGPSIVKDDKEAADLAHHLNNHVAKLRDNDPQGYGFFGPYPLSWPLMPALKKSPMCSTS